MRSNTPSLVSKLWSSIEVKLILAWLLVVGITAWLDPNHTYVTDTAGTSQLIIRRTVLLGFFALGSAIIIISGGIDLSSGSVIALSATVFGALMILLDPEGFRAGHVSRVVVLVAVAGTLLVGCMIGTLHAWLITRIGLPPFIATLATLVGLRSFGRGLVPTITGGKSQILRDALKNVTTMSILFVIFAIVLWFLMSRTVTGRHLHAMGGNEQAAKLSGIRTDRLKWFAYVIGSVSASIVGIIAFADDGSAKPDIMARGYELNAIAGSVIGGCSLQGGIGTIPGTILGCLFLRTVIDAVSKVVGSGADIYEGMIVGVVVVLAVTFSQRGAKTIARKYFDGAIGWAIIPILSLLSGLLMLLFFGKQDWYANSYGFVVAAIVAAILSTRAFWERKVDRPTAMKTIT
jgi:ribose/xylose/arabinose/galactoside ABC-type transport system permease subunit